MLTEEINQMVIKEFLSSIVQSKVTPDNIKESLEIIEGIEKALNRIDENNVLMLAKLDGDMSAIFLTQDEIKFLKKPELINVSDIIRETKVAIKAKDIKKIE